MSEDLLTEYSEQLCRSAWATSGTPQEREAEAEVVRLRDSLLARMLTEDERGAVLTILELRPTTIPHVASAILKLRSTAQ